MSPALTPKLGSALLVCLTLALGLLLTGILASAARSRVHEEAQARFRRSSDLLGMEVKRRFMLPGYGLKGVRAAFAANPKMDRAGFQALVAARDLKVEFPGVDGMGTIERVERSELGAFVENRRAEGAPSFAVHGEGGGPDLYVVSVIEPLAENLAAWGADLGAAPTSRTAIEQAVDTGLLTLAPREQAERSGRSLLLLAVYRPGLPLSTVAQRRAALRGLVFAPFDALKLLEGSLEASEALDFDVYAGPRGAPEDVLYDPDGHLTHSAESAGQRLFTSQELVQVGGLEVLLRTRTTPRFEATIDTSRAVTRLVAGTALSLIAAAIVWLLGRGRARALRLAQDMTREAEKAQREQRAMDLVIRGQFIVSVAGADGRIIAANDAMCAISGFTQEELYGMDHRVLGSGFHPREFWRDVWTTVTSGLPWRGEICNRAKNGELYWVDSLIAPFLEEDGGVAKFVSIRTDITARKAIEAELETQSRLAVAMAARAEEANHAKGSFLANMSHEIRTPMNGVLGMTELLLGMGLNPEQDHAARTVYRSAEALLVILNDILDFSKIEAGRLEFERLSFDVQQLLYDSVELFRGKVVGRPVELQVRIMEGAPAFVWGDPSRLRQVIANLVSNAVKFTAAGHVLLELERLEGRLVLRVVDTGPGIPVDRQPRLFEPFTQADASTSRRHGGTGLGLAISRRLVDGMGGTITLHSAVGEGTRFEVTLPLEEDLTVPQPSAGLLGGRRVLVVEPQALPRAIASEMLAALGASVESVADAESARSRLLAGGFEVVLLSDGNVDELTEVLRDLGRPREIAAVLWSTMGTRGGPRPQLTATVPRPCSQQVLAQVILEVLTRGAFPPPRLAPAAPSLPSRPPGSRRLRVLLAEDNAVNQHIARSMLNKQGCDVVVVNDGRDAVATFLKERWDLIFMDCQMPELDGYEATARIRAHESARGLARTTVIAMTANVMPEDRARCLAAGMDDHLAKPARAQDLAQVLAAWTSPAAATGT